MTGQAPQSYPQPPMPPGPPPPPGYGHNMPYGAPPPPPPPGWSPTRPTSGKAVASMVCSIVGLVGLAFCPLLVLGIPAGLILGLIAMFETGREGRFSGRGFAIAGLIISVIAMVAAVAFGVVMFSMIKSAETAIEQAQQEALNQDVSLIASRMQEYVSTHGSLSPGGPQVAPGHDTRWLEGPLLVTHFVAMHELRLAIPPESYEITLLGPNSARIKIVSAWGEPIGEAVITDAAAGTWHLSAQ